MSNNFMVHSKSPVEDWFCLGNAASDELLHALTLAGSALAETEREKQLIIWLTENHTYICGYGNVGFRIENMPWTKAGFESEKAFILRCIDAAKTKLWWDRRKYPLDEELVIPWLESFGKLVEQMTVEYVNEDELNEWLSWFPEIGKEYILRDFPTCERHKGMLVSLYGCRLCVDENGG